MQRLLKLRSLLLLVVVAGGLAVGLYYATRPQPQPRAEPRPYVWGFDMMDLVHLEIELSRAGMQGRWKRGEDRQWYFDDEQGQPVNRDRWGGVALLVSGPGANRRIAE